MASFADLLAQLNRQLPDYALTETIYQGSRTTVYRAVETASQRPVVIKVLSQAYPSFKALVRFRNQYTVAKTLPIAGIVRHLDLVACNNGYGLVLEDFGGVSLAQYVQQRDLALSDVLRIAIQLSGTLHELHQHRCIHKDINPTNILINPDSKQVKLSDFSIASRLPKESQTIQSPRSLEGTLAYLSPEQTGRMNRAIDYRTEFYALGVTLYHLFAGQLPFTSDDPLELLHCHLAQMPPTVDRINPAVPPVVAAIVAKLMAKTAEDRYQSALGLQHDLKRCLAQWERHGEIADFTLGQQDVSDRFTIPQKLYGRKAEVQALLEAFHRVAQGASELVLVAGFSGIGKTSVINEVHKPIVRQRGYVIKGKFDPLNRNIPFSAFVQAFRSLMGQLLSESDAELAEWRDKILAAVGDNGQVLIEVIPELGRIIGAQPAVCDLSGNAAQNRFNLVFQNFIHVFAAAAHPLVIVIDDMQWADYASLDLLKLLMAKAETGYLLVLGAYRDNEVFPAHPLMLAIDQTKNQTKTRIEKSQAQVHTLTLAPLAEAHIHSLVAEALRCSTELAAPLAKLIFQKTQGNPFFAVQLLQGLCQEGGITFDPATGAWEADLARIDRLTLTDDVIAFMVMRLQKLPAATQTILKLAACVGSEFDLETVGIISEQSLEAATANLWAALQAGLVLPTSEFYKFYLRAEDDEAADKTAGEPELDKPQVVGCSYRFLHDGVLHAAYSLIPNGEKQHLHFQIGQLLLDKTPESDRDKKRFEVVNQLNLGAELIQAQAERDRLAQLNLLAGQKAKKATAYASALDYFRQGYRLLAADCWRVNREQSLALVKAAAEAAYLTGSFDQMTYWTHLALEHIEDTLEAVDVHTLNIQALTAQNELQAAVSISVAVLRRLGIDLPDDPGQANLDAAVDAIKQRLQDRDIETLVDLPPMTDPAQLAAMQLLSTAIAPAYIAAPNLLPLLVIKQVELSLQFGNTQLSAYAYVMYGLILCGVVEDITLGYQFGTLAIKLLKKLDAKQFECRVLNIFNAFIRHWQAPLRDTLKPLQKGYRIGLDRGEIEFVGYCALNYSINAIWSGQELSATERQIASFAQVVDRFNQQTTHTYLTMYWQIALSLLTKDKPTDLDGAAYQAADKLPLHQQANDTYALATRSLAKLFIHYLFEDFSEAIAAAEAGNAHIDSLIGNAAVPIFPFYESLARLAVWDTLTPAAQTRTLEQVAANQQRMTHWAAHAPANYLAKFQLVAAEHHRVLGQRAEAIDGYDSAIATAKAHGYVQEEAIANELAAKFYLNWGKATVAAGYMQDAYYGYSRWGAKAKVTHLEARYPDLLRPILALPKMASDGLNTLKTLAAPKISAHSSPCDAHSLNETFDFASILKASQTLTSTLRLDELLRQFTQIILQNSGGDRCGLILVDEEEKLQVRAIATPEKTDLNQQPLHDALPLPVKLIQYVKNVQEVLVIDSLESDFPIVDDYLEKQQPKSILCLPISNYARCIGVISVENRLTRGVFTDSRIIILNFLCAQAAISLENARLYQRVQQTLTDLQQTQLQLVKSEKMSALGNLVTGVAHEINNPIGCITGNVDIFQTYVDNLLRLLDLYAKQFPAPGADIKDAIAAADLDYIREDLPALIRAVRDSSDRINAISRSLRTFSRGDGEAKQGFNLHDGIESTLLILRYRLKAQDFRPAIEVVTDYGKIPAIACFPGQLNQVFMNILANAVDALDEGSQNRRFSDLEASPLRITIRTEREKSWVKITISDNGPGISAAVKPKIFDYLFTTKDFYDGTGLGLAIARQIVEEIHGGTLAVFSEPGQGAAFCIRLPI